MTRDRSAFSAEWSGTRFEIVDTGGLEPGPEGLDVRIVEQAQVAIQAADLIVLVVDGISGPLEDDALVAAELRRAGKPVIVAVNKVDDPVRRTRGGGVLSLGVGRAARAFGPPRTGIGGFPRSGGEPSPATHRRGERAVGFYRHRGAP